jgi:hypothetical protein
MAQVVSYRPPTAELRVRAQVSPSGPYYPSGTIGAVPRAYEGMEGRKIQIKKWKNRKI